MGASWPPSATLGHETTMDVVPLAEGEAAAASRRLMMLACGREGKNHAQKSRSVGKLFATRTCRVCTGSGRDDAGPAGVPPAIAAAAAATTPSRAAGPVTRKRSPSSRPLEGDRAAACCCCCWAAVGAAVASGSPDGISAGGAGTTVSGPSVWTGGLSDDHAPGPVQ